MRKLIGNISANVLLAFLVGFAVSFGLHEAGAAQVNPFMVSAAIFGVHFTVDTVLTFGGYKKAGSPLLFMAVQKEIWEQDIIENLFRNNTFMRYAFNADQYVLQGKVVHIPVAGAKPTVVKNRSSVPASVTTRTDTDITYVLDEYTTDPVLIPNADKVELSYDKRQSVTGESNEGMSELVGDDMLIKWAKSSGGSVTTAYVIRTTGGPDAVQVPAHLPSATGNRLKMAKEDLKKAQTYMNKNNIPRENRYALFDSDMMEQFQDDPDLKKRDFGKELDLQEGVIGKLYGFNIMERSYVLTYDNAATPSVKALAAAAAATDNAAVLCWQQNAVERALGTVNFFEDLDNPEYYGDIYSSLLRAGGRNRRAAGVVAIVQGVPA